MAQGFCRLNECAGVPVRAVGETCPSSDVCVGAESAFDQPPQCGGSTPICGGAGTACYADRSGTGPDPVCASGRKSCTVPGLSLSDVVPFVLRPVLRICLHIADRVSRPEETRRHPHSTCQATTVSERLRAVSGIWRRVRGELTIILKVTPWLTSLL